MTHGLHGGGNHRKHNWFTALGKTIGTSKSNETDAGYVTEHRVLKYRTEFDATLESCWYGRVLLLFRVRVKTDEKDRNVRTF
jgi:hypothetical protein